MSGWTLVDSHRTQGRTFHRPLDEHEIWFLWNGFLNGSADGLQYCELRLPNGTQDAHLFSETNIVKAWVSTKRRYPLSVATIRGFPSKPHFVVREHDLAVLRPREIVFGTVACAEEVHWRMGAIINGPRPLSVELLMQLYVFREPDRTDVLHLITLGAHCMADRSANNTFVRCLLDTLARGGEFEPVQLPLEDRLAMATSSTERIPTLSRSLSPARRRWRRAVGIIIFQSKMAKRRGGHTLPRRLTRSTPHVPARSNIVYTSLTHTQTAAVMANCRSHDITFGNAFLALAQVAMTRVLYRRYLRGEISEDEWEYRKRQPHISGGPISFRPYLDKTWLAKGGGGEFMLSIGLLFYELPYMTLGKTAEQASQLRVLSDGAPPFSDLLTFDRFLHRTGLIKKQAAAFFGHPLFFEIIRAASLEQVEYTRPHALHWMQSVETANIHDIHGNSDDDEVLAVTDIPMVWAFGGSSAGNVDLTFPTEYPLPSIHPLSPYSSAPHPHKAGYLIPPLPSPSASEVDSTPKVVVESTGIHLRARPAECYLSADTSHGRLNMYVFYDSNVFEEGVATEWIDEVREAVIWYLGGTHRSRRAHQSPGRDRTNWTGRRRTCQTMRGESIRCVVVVDKTRPEALVLLMNRESARSDSCPPSVILLSDAKFCQPIVQFSNERLRIALLARYVRVSFPIVQNRSRP
ncbi:hypothetical protein HD554DRAFT_2028859 [Boletus coccyginus]|nr:hypothetical protein HD554DRAFT_2028859 [Boletus coccyginus]